MRISWKKKNLWTNLHKQVLTISKWRLTYKEPMRTAAKEHLKPEWQIDTIHWILKIAQSSTKYTFQGRPLEQL